MASSTRRLRLFDEGTQTETSPPRYSDSNFDYLHRVDLPRYRRARQLLEQWYADYPEAGKVDIRARFRSDDPGQHFGAWWELYVYALYRRLGYSVSVHPKLPKGDPDFVVSRRRWRWLPFGPRISAYVECVAKFGLDNLAAVSGTGAANICDHIDQIVSPDFRIILIFNSFGKQQPKVREIMAPIEAWLTHLDPDPVLREMEEAKAKGELYELPKLQLAVRDWDFTVKAWPRPVEQRGSTERMLGALPPDPWLVNDVERIRNAVSTKGRKYAKQQQLDKPLVVAVLNISAFGGEGDVADALFGRRVLATDRDRDRDRTGYWQRNASPNGADGSRVSAVLFGQNLNYMSVATVLPSLWINPWAPRLLETTDRLANRTMTDAGAVAEDDAATTAQKLFRLPAGWPDVS